MNAKKQLLLIGAGPTSSLIGYNIAKNQNLKDAIDIHVWEKSGGIGGRFSTHRSRKNPDCCVDLGAQYLTHTLTNLSAKSYFDNLLHHNLIRPLETSGIPGFRSDPAKRHYAFTQGSASIVKHFFQQASLAKKEMTFSTRVVKISPTSTGKVEVTTDNHSTKTFDIVISTMPVPQILQLESSSELLTEDTLSRNLETVKYSTRFALGLFFDNEVNLKTSSQPLNYINNDPILRYWSIENVKRNGSVTGPTSVVVHTSIDYGAKHADDDKEKVKPELLQKTIAVIPEAAEIPNDSVKSHKWRYSQVLTSYPGKPGCVRLNGQVLAAGDGFSESGFEGCIVSAEKAVELLESSLKI